MNVFTYADPRQYQPHLSAARRSGAHIVDNLLRGEALRTLSVLSLDENAHDIAPLLVDDPALKQTHGQLRRDLSDAAASPDGFDGELGEDEGDERQGAHDEHGDEAAEAKTGVDMSLPGCMNLLGLD